MHQFRRLSIAILISLTVAPRLPAGVQTAAEEPAAKRPSVQNLAWMTGYWVGEDKGVRMEECWLPPSGGMLLGIHRDISKSGKAFFEHLRIESRPDGLVYLASPGGRPAIAFPLTEISKNRVVFENNKHDFPKRIVYWLDPNGSLHARVEGDPAGKEKAKEWTWRKEVLAELQGN